MGGLARFFCLSGNASRRQDYRQQQYGESYGPQNHAAKVLKIIEEDLDTRLGGANCSLPNPASVPLRKVFSAGLPHQEANLCKELLGKIAALDQAREAADGEKAQLSEALKTSEKAHRQAEFSRAKAEALATARGEALMHAQQATREAQREQAQLSEMLKQALQQLGMAITPGRSQAGTPEGSLLTFDQSPSPIPLALPARTPPAARAAAAFTAQQQPQQQPQQQQGRRRQERAELRHSAGTDGSLEMSREFSGFTVYTNKLHNSAELGEVEAPARASREQGRPDSGAGGKQGPDTEEEEAAAALRRSRVPWRDISSAVEASLSVDFDARTSLGASRDGGSGALVPAAAEEPADPRERFQRMARLVLPTLDASQLDSLVRIGASLPSPDMLMSPEVLSQLLPKLWDSSANPVESNGLDVQQLLGQLQQGPEETEAAAVGQLGEGGAGAAAGLEVGPMGGGGSDGGLRASRSGKVPKAGTWLSPLKVGHRTHAEGEPTPSPQSHIKAVFRDTEDIQFYLPFSAGLHKPHTAAKEEYKTRAAQAAAAAPPTVPALATLPGSSPPRPPRSQQQQAPAGQPSKQPSGAAGPLSRQASGALAAAALSRQVSGVPSAGPLSRQQSAIPGPLSRQASAAPAVSKAQLSSWDLAVLDQLQQRRQQASEGSGVQQSLCSSGTAGSSQAGSVAGSVRGSRESLAAPAQPAGRKQAFLSRFQPMGSFAAQAAPAAGGATDGAAAGRPGSRPASRAGSVDENAREAGPVQAGGSLHRQPSGEGWQQQRQLGARLSAGRSSAEFDCAVTKRASDPHYTSKAAGASSSGALLDSTNAGGDGFLQRLAQQRARQAQR